MIIGRSIIRSVLLATLVDYLYFDSELSLPMKRFLLCGLLIFMTSFLFGQASDKGYYVTWNNDTIRAKFYIEGRASISFCLTSDGIQIIDSNKNKSWLLPTEAKECRFAFKGKEYRIFSKPDNQYGRKAFFHANIVGKRVSMYQCSSMPNMSISRWTVTYFALEKADGTLLSTSTQESASIVKEKIRRFFNSEPSMMKLMEERFKQNESLEKILKSLAMAYNGEEAK